MSQSLCKVLCSLIRGAAEENVAEEVVPDHISRVDQQHENGDYDQKDVVPHLDLELHLYLLLCSFVLFARNCVLLVAFCRQQFGVEQGKWEQAGEEEPVAVCQS